ncbi:TFIIB-type zinc ribbon-containing protein [Streptococcaceae bacterium ESL0687]|nr:TFIIB-type zinc ribbon-containing protein [Streptococcaceae bacterium ESL0687]
MANEKMLSVPIPTDLDGYSAFQCSLCSELFKITPTDFEDKSQIQIWCPSCGLIPDSIITEEIRELSLKIAKNHVLNLFNGFNIKLEERFKDGSIKYKAGKKIKEEPTDQLVSRIDILEIQTYECCHKEAKISPGLKMIGGYCPFCGEMQNGN